MINWDNIIEKEKQEYKNKTLFFPVHPSRCLIIAPSGAGKTNDLLTIIHNSVFHKLYLYAPSLDEDKYEYLIKMQKEKENILAKQGISESLIHFSTDIKDVVPLETLNKNFQHAYIFDDVCLEEKKQQEKYIGDHYIRSRKYNVSCFYLSQSFFKIPKIIRDNANFVVLKKLADNRELNTIHSIYCSEFEKSEFVEKYHEAVSSYGNHGSFIMRIFHQYCGHYLINFQIVNCLGKYF
jgi:hypothetical protein